MPPLSPGILSHLTALYGAEVGRETFNRLSSLLDHYRAHIPSPRLVGLSERDSILIAYGDQVSEPGTLPLRTLADFCARHLARVVSSVHILPFFPYSSDDGFSVIDYRTVNRAWGDWEDIAHLGQAFRLMFDAVVNHASARSEWFQGFLRDDPHLRDYFIVVPQDADLSRVVRPRPLPLLTPFSTPGGDKSVWTTFSADQIDLNYANPDVLLEILDVLLFYVSHGAQFIRLDAVAFLWKQFGTPCIHLPQTHRIVRLMRAVLDTVAPHVMLITETNVPHSENLSYFGDGHDEAQMVYNFALPPLALHALHTGNAETLSRWAAGLALPSNRVTFFNFLASHDGIGLNPARGILTEAEINALVEHVKSHDGLVSYKSNPDGTQSPYELNINYFDALSNPNRDEPPGMQVERFITSQAIMLTLVGVPGLYFHSLFGSRGWPEGAKQTGHNRTINREKCERAMLEAELADPHSRRHQVFGRYKQLLQTRAAHAAFHPHGEQHVLTVGPSVFTVLRVSPRQDERVFCMHNVSDHTQPVELDVKHNLGVASRNWKDLITGRRLNLGQTQILAPYQTVWLTPEIG